MPLKTLRCRPTNRGGSTSPGTHPLFPTASSIATSSTTHLWTTRYRPHHQEQHYSGVLQAIAFQVGQVPQKPINEWMTYHVIGENLNEGPQKAEITDYLEPGTAYAVVIQAVNEDGPGPYSIQHSIRTMSRG